VSFVVQPSLFGSSGELGIAELGAAVERRPLSDGAWVDLRPGFVTAADELFDALASTVPWHEERMHIYDTTVRVPRLLAGYREGEALPHPVLDEARSALSAHYADELGEPFVSVGLCLYRDGNDSVPGTETGSLARALATRWWRSSRLVPRDHSGYARRRADPDCGSRSDTAICL
jgi:hypothetical protein